MFVDTQHMFECVCRGQSSVIDVFITLHLILRQTLTEPEVHRLSCGWDSPISTL